MSGYVTNSLDINNKAGQLVVAMWKDLVELRDYHVWLNDATHDQTYFTSVGVDAATLADLRAGIGDLGNPTNGLYAVAHGAFLPLGLSNYFFNAKKLSGTTYAG